MKHRLINSIGSIKTITIIIILFLVVASLLVALLIYKDYKREFLHIVSTNVELEELFVTMLIDEFESQSLSSALCISNMCGVKKAYMEENEKDAIDSLNYVIGPLVESIKHNLGYSKYKVHFHKPPAVSFLREWNQTGGDDLSSFRNTILKVYETESPVKGVELGKGGFAIRGISPIFDNAGEYIGSVEVFFEIIDLLPYLNYKNKAYDIILLADKTKLDKIFFSAEKAKYYNDVVGGSVIIENTLDTNKSNISSELILNKLQEKTDQKIITYENYSFYEMELIDFNSEKVGSFIFIFNNEELQEQTRNKIFRVVGIIIGIGVLLAFLVFILMRRVTRKLENVNMELKESIAIKDKFFKIIAHDLKSPFSTLIGFSDLLMQQNNISDGNQEKFIKLINDVSKNGLGLVENLLLWATSQTNEITYHPIPINLYDASNSVLNILERLAQQKNITIINGINNSINVFVDKQVIAAIFRNLISNAIKFTEEKGQITLNAVESGDFIKVQIIDNGIGMSEDLQNRLFMINENVTRSGTNHENGSGLGLLIIKEFVDKSGGELNVISKEDEGSTFEFTLKLAP
ncbi:MAG: hypothetical protein B7C24_17010 [Bacteroidetes bacterium 4572_77]|nr:MAG: hypothetical protein B7C24_17010 [Bacteroidetes bacterium 4572_77]